MSRRPVNEGMRAGDLEDLVLPLISVDEYESKVDDKAIVTAFYVSDHDAAHDLNRFIQKSPTLILDTEVSPAPDQQGYYLVFFELLNNERFAEHVSEIIDEVSPLVRIDNWQMRVRGMDRLIGFSEQALKAHFDEVREEADEVSESVMKFFQPSHVERVLVDNDSLVLEGYGYQHEFDIVAFGPLDKIAAEQELMISEGDVGIGAIVRETKLDRRLGEGWSVSSFSGLSLVLRADSENALLLRSRNP